MKQRGIGIGELVSFRLHNEWRDVVVESVKSVTGIIEEVKNE